MTGPLKVMYDLAQQQGSTWEPHPTMPGYERHRLADMDDARGNVWRDNWLVRPVEAAADGCIAVASEAECP